MEKIYGAEYLLNGYITYGHPEPLSKNGIRYTVQRYQGKHKNEFTLRTEAGDIFLFESNVLKQKWRENKNGNKLDEFIAFKNGRVDFHQRFHDIQKNINSNRNVYHKKGLRMEIWSAQTGHLLYHGECNGKRLKDGWGIEYDEESGNVAVEGMWSNGILKEVIRCFNGDTMTELKRNGADSLDPTKRIPIYVGGYRYDEDNERFLREGKGCLIDEKTGIATRECEWKDGKEVSGMNLIHGWYNYPLKLITIRSFQGITNMSLQVTDLTVSSNCCNDLNELNLNSYELLQSIEIGDECFGSVQTFKIDGLNRLKTIKIGSNSFTQKKNGYGDDQSKSFHILNCESLQSTDIGEWSFSDFAGDFELKNLPQLQSIRIGTTGNWSFNFYNSSFVIRGIDMILYNMNDA